MIIDSHAHFEPRMLELDQVVAKLDEAGVERVALIPAMNDPLPETPERLLSVMRTLMSSRWGRPLAELVHRATLTGGNLRLGRKVYAIYAQPDNASVAGALARYPERFRGWIFLNPRAPGDPLEELERWRAVPGMIGIKLHPHWHDYETGALATVLARAEELRLPVLIHLGFRRRGDYRAICQRFPRLPLIAAHAGFPFYQELWSNARSCPNLRVDLSSPYLDEALARAAVRELGAERCLYGTDSPYGFHAADESYDYGEIKRWVERMPLSAAERDRIFADNFRELVAGARG